jgi:outer membrane protein assembly factor BamB
MSFRALDRVYFLTRKIVVALVIIAAAPALDAADVLTWHNDRARTGQNLAETVLTPANVNPTNFGKLFIVSVDGQVYAQPLLVSGLSIPGQGVHDVLYIATQHDSVYACDANDGTVLWQVSMLRPGETTADVPMCGEIAPELGITATPVIDRTSGPNGTIYVEAMTTDGATGNYFQRLHALDLTTGAEQFGGPVDIAATYPGTGDNSDGVNVIFDPKQYKERAGLVLNDDIIYLSWTSHCDIRPYTGWMMGYDETTLAQVKVLNLTPNGNSGAIWAGGAAPAVDADGSIYVMAGNGSFETSLDADGFPNRGDYGNCFVKLSTANNTLQVADYWTMFNTIAESSADLDLGAGGPILLPDMIDSNLDVRHLAVGAGKDLHIYIVDRDNMGKFNADSNSTIYQDLPSSLGGGRGTRATGAPAYFNGMLYFGAVNDNLRAFTFTNALLNGVAASTSATTFPYPGTIPSISANGLSNGIVWALEKGSIAVLHAYDATDLTRELYNSNQAANSRDVFGAGSKFSVPTVANGKVLSLAPPTLSVAPAAEWQLSAC